MAYCFFGKGGGGGGGEDNLFVICKLTTLYTDLKFIQSRNDLLPSEPVRKAVRLISQTHQDRSNSVLHFDPYRILRSHMTQSMISWLFCNGMYC